MSWIAVTRPEAEALPAPHAGFPGLRVADRLPPTQALPRGSLYAEADLGRWKRDDQILFVLHWQGPETSHISVHLGADGAVIYGRRLGNRHRQVTLTTGDLRLEGTIRLTISWDLPARRGLLSLEVVSDGTLLQKEFADPLPWELEDVMRLKAPAGDVAFGPALCSLGLSDRLEPVGVAPGLAPGTPVLTPSGFRPIETLRPGDMVETCDGGASPVIWSGCREVLARGRFRPIRMHAPYLGLASDVVVAPEQRLVIRGAEVEYLFSEEAALVEAHTLLHSNFAAIEPAGATIRYHQILLEEHTILNIAGAQMESLFIGDLRENPGVLRTTILGGFPAKRLPIHAKLAYPALRNYEALTLRAALVSR